MQSQFQSHEFCSADQKLKIASLMLLKLIQDLTNCGLEHHCVNQGNLFDKNLLQILQTQSVFIIIWFLLMFKCQALNKDM